MSGTLCQTCTREKCSGRPPLSSPPLSLHFLIIFIPHTPSFSLLTRIKKAFPFGEHLFFFKVRLLQSICARACCRLSNVAAKLYVSNGKIKNSECNYYVLHCGVNHVRVTGDLPLEKSGRLRSIAFLVVGDTIAPCPSAQ